MGHSADRKLAWFSGPWSDYEREEIHAALEALEERLANDRGSALGALWTCCCTRCGDRRLYSVMRMPGHHVIAAWDAEELASKIDET